MQKLTWLDHNVSRGINDHIQSRCCDNAYDIVTTIIYDSWKVEEMEIKLLLPPVYEVRAKVIFSLCAPWLGGGGTGTYLPADREGT